MTTDANSQPLKVFFEPRTLTQLGVLSGGLVVSIEYQQTEFQKTGWRALMRKLPIFKSMTPFKPPMLDMDIDLSCVMLDKSQQVVDKVWYGNLRSSNESVRHGGDALTGAKTLEDRLANQEVISIRLSELPKEVHHLLFVISSYYKHPLSRAKKGVTKMVDAENQLIHATALDTLSAGEYGVLAWCLERCGEDFLLSAPQKGLANTFCPTKLAQDLDNIVNMI